MKSPDIPGRFNTTYVRNAAGQTTSVTTTGDTSRTIDQPGTINLGYDAAGRLHTETLPSGDISTVSYDANSGVSQQQLKNSGGTVLAQQSYIYDPDERITQQGWMGTSSITTGTIAGTQDSRTYCYFYTGGHVAGFTQVSAGTSCSTQSAPSAGTAGYISYDADGNLSEHDSATDVVKTYYNLDDSANYATDHTSSTTTQIDDTYFDFGGLKAATDHGNGATCTSYSYDGHDRTTAVTTGASTAACPSSSANTVTYLYDGLDRQASSTTGTQPAVNLHQVGASSTVLDEATGSTDNVTYAINDGQPLAVSDSLASGADTQYLVGDGQGSVATTTSTDGTVACATRFDPFGSAIQSPAATGCAYGSSKSDLFYQSDRRESLTGDYQFGSRTYDPAKASFTTPDQYRTGPSVANLSIGTDPLTADTYTYVNGDPVNFWDLSGHSIEAPDPDGNRYYHTDAREAAFFKALNNRVTLAQNKYNNDRASGASEKELERDLETFLQDRYNEALDNLEHPDAYDVVGTPSGQFTLLDFANGRAYDVAAPGDYSTARSPQQVEIQQGEDAAIGRAQQDGKPIVRIGGVRAIGTDDALDQGNGGQEWDGAELRQNGDGSFWFSRVEVYSPTGDTWDKVKKSVQTKLEKSLREKAPGSGGEAMTQGEDTLLFNAVNTGVDIDQLNEYVDQMSQQYGVDVIGYGNAAVPLPPELPDGTPSETDPIDEILRDATDIE